MRNAVFCKNVKIGGGAGISIQSMTNTDTCDLEATLKQIESLQEAGADIVRLAVPDAAAGKALYNIRKHTEMPLVADIHFDYKLALTAIDAGFDKIRINPGNIAGRDKLLVVARSAKAAGIPIRVGVNSGSVNKKMLSERGMEEAIIEAAVQNIRALEEVDFKDIVVSVKSSDIRLNTAVYRRLYKMTNHPFHIGLTEAGTLEGGIIKSSMAMGALLVDGIGDTMRVSLTGDPIEEVVLAKQILNFLKLRSDGFDFVSCPTCARTHTDLISIAERIETRLKKSDVHGIKVAVMGCEVNGPGEARDADIGVACFKGGCILFKEGKPLKKISEDMVEDEIVKEALICMKDKEALNC